MSRDSKSALRRVNADIRETLRNAAAAIDAGDWQKAHEFYFEVAALASSAAESAERNADIAELRMREAVSEALAVPLSQEFRDALIKKGA